MCEHIVTKTVKTFLFACVHNAGRSQIAAALFNRCVDQEKCCAISAGTQPALHVHPEVVEVMREVGIDLSGAKPQKLTEELARHVSVLITTGCGEACPFIPGVKTIDWALPDPKARPLDEVRAIREQIKERIAALVRDECADCTVSAPE